MSAHETEADMERAVDVQMSDFESRTHEVRVVPANAGPVRKHRPSCAVCGPLGDWTTDYPDAKATGRSHEASFAADAVVAAGVNGDE